MRAFLDSEFRRDVKNFGLYFWPLQFQKREKEEQENAWAEQAMRAAQYLSERGYFAIEDIPAITRAVNEIDTKKLPQRPYAILQRLIASKMGSKADQPIPECLSFLASEKAGSKSLNNYLRSTDEYKKLVADWEKSNQKGPKPKPEDVWGNADWLDEIFRFGGEVVAVKLKSRIKPFSTNGKWDAETEMVKWRQSVAVLQSNDVAIPMIAFALWSQPNEELQIKHFGRVVLDEFSLGQYCIWYHGLNESEAEQWGSFLATITPDANIKKKLDAFRFDHEPPAQSSDDSGKDMARHVRSLILSGLANK